MKVDWFAVFLIAYIAMSGAGLGYLGTDESFKYINATFRWWLIGYLVITNAGAAAIKGLFTESQKDINENGDNPPPIISPVVQTTTKTTVESQTNEIATSTKTPPSNIGSGGHPFGSA